MGVLLSVVRLVFLRPLHTSLSFIHRYFSALVRFSLDYMDQSKQISYQPRMGNTNYSTDHEYDSTWEDEEDNDSNDENKELSTRRHYSAYRNTYAARDMKKFRDKCGQVIQDDNITDEELQELNSKWGNNLPNLLFYQNKIKSRPDGLTIDQFHKNWLGDYEKLEWVHSYIQWLFPIQEPGVNSQAYVLTPEEIKLFRRDKKAKERLWCSYHLMLDFYGIKIVDDKTGRVARAENWKERFQNLNRNTHNNLRITRILKCLGLLGFQHYQAPLVKFFLHETLVEGTLPRVKQSVLDYFMFAVLDKSERKELIRFAFQHFKPTEEFVWCPKKIQRRFLKEMEDKKAEDSESACSESEPNTSQEETQTVNEKVSTDVLNNNEHTDRVKEEKDADKNLKKSEFSNDECHEHKAPLKSKQLEIPDKPDDDHKDSKTDTNMETDPPSREQFSDLIKTGRPDDILAPEASDANMHDINGVKDTKTAADSRKEEDVADTDQNQPQNGNDDSTSAVQKSGNEDTDVGTPMDIDSPPIGESDVCNQNENKTIRQENFCEEAPNEAKQSDGQVTSTADEKSKLDKNKDKLVRPSIKESRNLTDHQDDDRDEEDEHL